MNSDYVKKLTGKNPQDFELAASHIIDNADFETFKELVQKSDFLFDFIKQNVLNRLLNAVNSGNFKNLLSFLKLYSCDYEDFIILPLVKHADEEITDIMLELLENGSKDEKTYASKYFYHINDTLALESLRKNAFDDFYPLMTNCASALSALKDEISLNTALTKLKSEDEFEKLSAVQFLASYGAENNIEEIFKALKESSMPENIASEIPYIIDLQGFLDSKYKDDILLTINYIIDGLGEIIPLCQVLDFQLFEIIEKINKSEMDSKSAIVILNAKLKFDNLTENEEYIFDEDKNTKNEVFAIKNILSKIDLNPLKELIKHELKKDSPFVFSALQLVEEFKIETATDNIKTLLNSSNQTIILKTVEVIKSLNQLEAVNLEEILKEISDANIKIIITSLFRS